MRADTVPPLRVRALLDRPPQPGGTHVLYWMTAFRRPGWNFALQRALDWCVELRRPLIVLEGLRLAYRWASDRFHRFVLDGMEDNAAAFARAGATYLRYLEPERGAGRGLLEALSAKACVVVGDDFPAFFLPSAIAAAQHRLGVRFEVVDSNGLLPLRAPGRAFTAARFFRLYLQRNLREHLVLPDADPFARRSLPERAALPRGLASRFPSAERLDRLAIDHRVAPVEGVRGGARAGAAVLARFVGERLDRYAARHADPDDEATSGLSPYLHFGHVGSHQALDAIAASRRWNAERLEPKPRGGARGWWGLDENAEAFLEQLVTWRELGFNFCAYRDDADAFDSLPTWARASLKAHAKDPRPFVYSFDQLEGARTHDEVWNAAQRQLVREGRIHNYLRMLWGKKVLEWSPRPEEALETLLALNDRWALDGRDPNSSSGILWVFGRYDRPWFERPIFGKVRFMSSQAARRKLRLARYLERFAAR